MVTGVVRCSREAGEHEWDVVIGRSFIVALDAPAPSSALAALAGAGAEASTGLEGLVGRIPLGDVGVRSFALAWWPPEGGPLTVVVRGDAAVDVASPGGRRRLDSRGITPWHLAEFRDVTAVRIGGAESPLDAIGAAGYARVPGTGFVRASSVEWQAEEVDGGADREAGIAGIEPTRLVPLRELGAWATAGARAAEGPGGAEHGAPPAPRHAVTQPLRIRIGGGDPIAVTGVVRIGRNPQPPNAAGAEPVELVSVGRAASEVSATHLELRLEGSRLVATDLRSTNGTVVRTPSGARRMRTGESIVVVPGAVLDLGSDTIVEILPPQDDRALSTRQGTTKSGTT